MPQTTSEQKTAAQREGLRGGCDAYEQWSDENNTPPMPPGTMETLQFTRRTVGAPPAEKKSRRTESSGTAAGE